MLVGRIDEGYSPTSLFLSSSGLVEGFWTWRSLLKDHTLGMIVFVEGGSALELLGLLFLDGPPPMQVPALVVEEKYEVTTRLCYCAAEDDWTEKEITKDIVTEIVRFNIQA